MDFIKEPGRIYAQDESGKLVAEIDFPSRNGLAAITHTLWMTPCADTGSPLS